MMHRSNDRGTFVIDRLFDTVGHIKRASGTTDRKVFREIDAMLTAFKSQARYDLLEAIRDGKLRGVYVLTWWKQRSVERIPTADVLPPLGATWDAWAKALDCSPSHRRSVGITRKSLALTDSHILADLPERLATYVKANLAHPFSASMARVHAQAFLRDTLGTKHALYGSLGDLPTISRPRAKARAQRSPDEVRRLIVQLGEEAGECAWAMCAYGMLPKEYWEDGYEVLPDRIRVHGQKRTQRERDVPRWTSIGGPRIARDAFRYRLKRADKTIRPTDFRRFYSRWCEEAGISGVNHKAYMGHGPKTMTELYTFGEMAGQMAEDATKLKGYTNEPDIKPALKVASNG